MMKNILIWSISLAFCSTLWAQKIEKEVRIESSEVNEAARKMVQNVFPKSKIYWVLETNQDGKTIEAKLKYDRTPYSIEFQLDGELIDIEKEVKFKEIASAKRSLIQSTFVRDFKKYAIQKVQVQYTDSQITLDQLKVEDGVKSEFISGYEITVFGKTADSHASYEYAFDEEGILKGRLKVLNDNSDNLFY